MKNILASFMTLVLLASCGQGSSGNGDSGKKGGVKVILTEKAKSASLRGARTASTSGTLGFSDTDAEVYVNVLASFDDAFSLGDSAVHLSNGVPLYNENGELTEYLSEEDRKVVVELNQNQVGIEEKVGEECTATNTSSSEGEEGESEWSCTDIMETTYYERDEYEKMISTLFDIKLLAEALKAEGESGEVVVDLLSYSPNGTELKMGFSMKGEIDGENIDAEFYLKFDLALPFVANPTNIEFYEQGMKPQIQKLIKLNGMDM